MNQNECEKHFNKLRDFERVTDIQIHGQIFSQWANNNGIKIRLNINFN